MVVFVLRVFFLFLERMILLQLKQKYASGEVAPSAAQVSPSGSLGAGAQGGGGADTGADEMRVSRKFSVDAYVRDTLNFAPKDFVFCCCVLSVFSAYCTFGSGVVEISSLR